MFTDNENLKETIVNKEKLKKEKEAELYDRLKKIAEKIAKNSIYGSINHDDSYHIFEQNYKKYVHRQ